MNLYGSENKRVQGSVFTVCVSDPVNDKSSRSLDRTYNDHRVGLRNNYYSGTTDPFFPYHPQ